MSDPKPVVVVTGAAGNLGIRLLPQLTDFSVHAVDVVAPPAPCEAHFSHIDLGDEHAGTKLFELLRDTNATAVVHLAFIIDPVRMGVLDTECMWKINVAGTGRVIEAIAQANRAGGKIRKFIYPSSVSVYGPEIPPDVMEEHPLGAHTLPYAVHKREAEQMLQQQAGEMGACSTYVLRPHIYAGASMQNYLIGALRGTPTGRGKLGRSMRSHHIRLPLILPAGSEYRGKRFQFVHVDDVARLIAWILNRKNTSREAVILNVPGKGEAVTLGEAAVIAHAQVLPLPGRAFCRWTLQLMWALGISGVPPEALPYMIGSYTMDAARLRTFLGADYDRVMQYTVEQALQDSFRTPAPAGQSVALHATSPP